MGTTRRNFVKLAVGALATCEGLPLLAEQAGQSPEQALPDLTYRSRYLRVQLAPTQPNFLAFSVDSLGQNKLDGNVMLPLPASNSHYHVSRTKDVIEYRRDPSDPAPAWRFTFSELSIVIHAFHPTKNPYEPIVLDFDASATHATLLGLVSDEGAIRLPEIGRAHV